ncbi:hypothetical protein [Streptomyces sp. NPDC057694]|uniref:hypothetical protein n=1 Tax=Streptomyces sp. NPDC057694 TaxID=3346216 RepID=UPI0036B10AC4
MAHRISPALAMTGSVVALMCAIAAQPASAADSWQVAFYTGTGQTGTASVPSLDDTSCHNLNTPALSARNYSDVDIQAYYNADCKTGAPGQGGDGYFALGSLHTANFPYPVVSYRVVHTG